MAKINVNFEMNHSHEKKTNGTLVFFMDLHHKPAYQAIQQMIAKQFNCPVSTITIVDLTIQ